MVHSVILYSKVNAETETDSSTHRLEDCIDRVEVTTGIPFTSISILSVSVACEESVTLPLYLYIGPL